MAIRDMKAGLHEIAALTIMILDHMKMEVIERLVIIQFNKSYKLAALVQAGCTFVKSNQFNNKQANVYLLLG